MKASGLFEVFQMLFKYTPIIDEKTAKKMAKICRVNLIHQMSADYAQLAAVNLDLITEYKELTVFLSDFHDEILKINHCQNTTKALQAIILKTRNNLETHPKYESIKLILDNSLNAIAQETRLAQERDKYITENKIAKINNNAINAAALPTIVVIVGAILTIFNPIGVFVLGVSGIALIISQAIFWIDRKNTYSQLQTKITEADLAIDLADDDEALPAKELTKVLKAKSEGSPVTGTESASKEPKPYLFSEKLDQQLDQGIEIAAEFASEVKDLVCDSVYGAAAAIGNKTYGLFSSLNKAIIGEAPAKRVIPDLHDL